MWISIDEKDNRPIYLQIINQVKYQVRRGVLKPGDELPSVRELAESLAINMHTVRSAYLKLRDQGIINLRLGRRARIARLRQPVHTPDMEADLQVRLEELVTDALLMGYSDDDLRDMLDRYLEQMGKEE